MTEMLASAMRLQAMFGAYTLFVLAIPAAALAGILWLTMTTAQEEQGTISPGFKGLLFLFAAMQVFHLASNTAEFGVAAFVLLDGRDSERLGVSGNFPIVEGFVAAVVFVELALSAVSLLLMLRRSRRFPRFFERQYWWMLSMGPLLVIGSALLMNRFYDTPVTAPAVIGVLLSLAGEWIAILLVGGFWLAYVAQSERAEQTFVR